MPFSSLNFAICVGLDTTDMIDFLYFVFVCFFLNVIVIFCCCY